MLRHISLPKPSDTLTNLVKRHATIAPINHSSLSWHSTVQNHKVNCVEGSFFKVPEVYSMAKDEYQQYFKVEITPIVGRLINTNPTSTASYPPHIDKSRSTAINFYIDEGGDNVETVFYQPYNSLNNYPGKVLTYDDVQPIARYVLPKHAWYALDVRKFHSVENIKTIRIMLALSFYDVEFKNIDNILVSPNY